MKRIIALVTLLSLVGPAPAAKRPNILLVLSDDHSVPHVGCYGNPDIKTPNLDKFAAEGLRFDRTYVTCPQCVPSRASIMTGRSPVAVQMTRFSAPLAAEYKVFPELLRAAGYYSGVAGRTYHLDGAGEGRQPAETARVFREHGLVTFPKRLDFVKQTSGSARILAQYREFLDSVPKGKPFVLELCFNDPHRPLDRNAIPQPHDPAKLKLPPWYPDTAGVRDDFARYYDEIGRFDRDFGDVLAELTKRGFANNTLVMMMGDNGASQFRGKGTLYEYGVHVPLIARWPGVIKPGSSSAELVSGEDLAPTYLESAGVAVPKEMTGKSFVKLLKGEPFEGRKYAFSERGAHGQALPTNSANFDLGRVVIGKRHKLIYTATWQIPFTPVDFAGDTFWKELVQMHKDGKLDPLFERLYFAPTRPMFELFDLEADPSEFKNLYGANGAAGVQKELLAALQEWMILQRDFLPLPVPPGR